MPFATLPTADLCLTISTQAPRAPSSPSSGRHQRSSSTASSAANRMSGHLVCLYPPLFIYSLIYLSFSSAHFLVFSLHCCCSSEPHQGTTESQRIITHILHQVHWQPAKFKTLVPGKEIQQKFLVSCLFTFRNKNPKTFFCHAFGVCTVFPHSYIIDRHKKSIKLIHSILVINQIRFSDQKVCVCIIVGIT